MDDTTRDISRREAAPGTGWSSGLDSSGSDLPRRDPWTGRPSDTGPLPRPGDTRAFPQPPGVGSSDTAGGEPTPAGAAGSGQSAPASDPSRTRIAAPGEPPAGWDTPPPATPATDTRPARRSTALLVALALGAGGLAGVGGAAAYDALTDDAPASTPSSSLAESDDDTPADQTAAPSLDSVEAVADQVLPSVVSISVGAGGGSGVIISSDGQILTNNHVVEAAQGGQIVVTFHDGSTASADVVGTDPTTDLAVIQAQDVTGLQAADLGSSADVQVGEQVVAIGSPLGLDGTVTTGIVSALNRPVTAGGQQGGSLTVFDAIQTDAPINPGNSGGALVNMAGEVVGINSAIASTGAGSGSIGLGFAIPIDQAGPIAQELIDTGSATHAQIGIGVDNTSGEVRGAAVREVQPGSAAAEAGLENGDTVTHIDDRLVTDAESLIAAVRSYRPGDEVELTVVRDGETITLPVTLGSDASST